MDTKYCYNCQEHKPKNEFFDRRLASGNVILQAKCKACEIQRARAWRKKNPDKVKKLRKDYGYKLKQLVFTHYGRECKCCHEKQLAFLCIDHISGGGNAHRKVIKRAGSTFWQWLKTEGFPEGYQVLCQNCNMAVRYNKTCPHQETNGE